ncbi:hypothetical protein LEA_03192 [human gut metagenome]|uniref:Uncharacterized protein n=1 Tax=human gut metagenome TaxID=408170 RepID=K1U958_9ZZZZ
MEFPNLGEYHDNLSLEEAIRIYQEIPAERMNGIKGIGFELKDGSDYEGPFPILTGQTIDLDTIQAIDYYRDNPLVTKSGKGTGCGNAGNGSAGGGRQSAGGFVSDRRCLPIFISSPVTADGTTPFTMLHP